MICEVCQTENATVHLTQIISGKMQKIDLCEKCAKEKGVADPAGFSLADMLLGLGAGEEIKAGGSDELQCPQCGFTQPDFKKTGRLGCANCYTTFATPSPRHRPSTITSASLVLRKQPTTKPATT